MELKYSITGKETSDVNEVYNQNSSRDQKRRKQPVSMSLSSKPFFFWQLLSIGRRMTMKVMMEVRVMFMSNMK